MDFSAALPTFVITLREGVEAALVVGIVLACLKKAQASDLNPWVYSGVVSGIVVSALVGWLFSGILFALSQSDHLYAPVVESLLKAGFCLVAIAMLSWMLIWMTKQAKALKGEIETAVSSAIQSPRSAQDSSQFGINQPAAWGIFTLIFIAVLREGFETVLFIVAQFQQGWTPAIGALLGLLGAVLIGVLLFQGGVRINLRLFFQLMGILLLLIVSGLVISALKNVDNAAMILSEIDARFSDLCFSGSGSCLLGPMVWDTSEFLSDRQFPGMILKALFGYRSHLYLAQAVGYMVFLFTVGSFYFSSLGGERSKSQTSAVSRQ
ncbi:FTR1 family protein [Planktothricoides raciborskii]|uniref:FTR1 family protein n=1 Tax=Planktothricoides raciborskii GIHE-MW2 TaxID=2792601 RepID=A0AAU8JHN9_9CYAN